MEKQLIISVGREFGSGGHVIAEELARRFEIPFFDSNLLAREAAEENVANMQFDLLKRMAGEGKSFVVVGRCSEAMLKEFPGMISLFILGDYAAKTRRIMEKYEMTEEQAHQTMRTEDWKRKSYHNYYCKGKWGDSRNYDFSINSSKLGVEKTVDIIEIYIKERLRAQK